MADDARLSLEVGQLEHDGWLVSQIVLWDTDLEPPLEACFMLGRAGGESLLLLATEHDFPESPPRAYAAPFVPLGHGEELYDAFRKGMARGRPDAVAGQLEMVAGVVSGGLRLGVDGPCARRWRPGRIGQRRRRGGRRMTAWDRVERLIGSDGLHRLAQAHVVVVGVGSGGGFVALSLAMSGVGRFTLVDMEALEQPNIVRHVADARYLGVNKAQALADLIAQRNPDAQVRVITGNITDHPDALNGADLMIVGVDGEGMKYHLNEMALARNLPAVYAGVYARGEGGDVCVIRPYDGPCYACWAAGVARGPERRPGRGTGLRPDRRGRHAQSRAGAVDPRRADRRGAGRRGADAAASGSAAAAAGQYAGDGEHRA
ncbi:MAG: ThiF family adenylyltransferase [Chloroflexi bacterium]|nr:ThiF family adenylyltransferase [Chloroflexota bacterium]